ADIIVADARRSLVAPAIVDCCTTHAGRCGCTSHPLRWVIAVTRRLIVGISYIDQVQRGEVKSLNRRQALIRRVAAGDSARPRPVRVAVAVECLLAATRDLRLRRVAED